MTAIWNRKDSKPPPVCLLRNRNNADDCVLYEKTREALQTCAGKLENLDALFSESYVLARLIYKMKSQLRSEKSLRILKQLLKCLKNFSDMDLKKQVDQVKSIYEEVDISDLSVFLPSQQMMQFFLTRLYGATVLLQKTSDYSVTCYELLQQQLANGTLIPQNMVILSLVSRVWAICKSLSLHLRTCYNDIFPAVETLEATKVK